MTRRRISMLVVALAGVVAIAGYLLCQTAPPTWSETLRKAYPKAIEHAPKKPSVVRTKTIEVAAIANPISLRLRPVSVLCRIPAEMRSIGISVLSERNWWVVLRTSDDQLAAEGTYILIGVEGPRSTLDHLAKTAPHHLEGIATEDEIYEAMRPLRAMSDEELFRVAIAATERSLASAGSDKAKAIQAIFGLDHRDTFSLTDPVLELVEVSSNHVYVNDQTFADLNPPQVELTVFSGRGSHLANIRIPSAKLDQGLAIAATMRRLPAVDWLRHDPEKMDEEE